MWNQYELVAWEAAKAELGPARSGWIFRGQRDSRWSLEPSLSRVMRLANLSLTTAEAESWLVTEFQRGAHLIAGANLPIGPEYGPNSDSATHIEWLALMQHFGAPTRLLDWTRSPYVAAYFAIEDADSSCAIWGLDTVWFREQARQILEYQNAPLGPMVNNQQVYLSLIMGSKSPGVFPLDLPRANERSLIQQGTFTVFGSPDKSVEDNLAAYDAAAVTDHVIKLVIPATQRAAALADLDRMNIHRGSLFPGLAGYAQSLAYRLTGRQTLP